MARKAYTGPIVDVSFDPDICQHSGNCVRGMPLAFDTAVRPWIDPTRAADAESASLLRDVVGRCPSGALRIEEHEEPKA